ncbi:hypothetical protein FGU71_01825 [Erythrobacter insulae]|uniref:DUF2306 domain-containing protein n=1 Tax=Erythrobacter insulae TaxID=2584124 RepID=A0A547P9G2_9SPHN|nr:hypothetical protein [Erythrobacter insulae]TRD10727.1 hypothetical protein FGU71_01825 [Erythrobacter insulae]
MSIKTPDQKAAILLGRIALALLLFTVIAFGAKALMHTEVQARYTPLVMFHGVTMLVWLALLSGQAYLAANARYAVHRATGLASIALVGAMAVSGGILAVNIGEELGRPEVTVVNIAAFVTFIPLYLAAVQFARQRNIHAHRQAMLIGTLALMTPAYARVVQVLALPDPVAIGVQVPITIALAVGYDWLIKGRITREVLAMLAFSVAVIAVMVVVLAIWFL